MRPLAAISVLALLALAGPDAAAQNVGSYGMAPRPGALEPEAAAKLAIKQNLDGKVPLDAVFFDHDNNPVALREIMGGKPTILVPAYYRCPKLCNEVLNGLVRVLRELQADDPEFAAGRAFNVVTFSIDAHEPYARARMKREEYLKQYDGRDPTQPGWWFLSSSAGQMTDARAAQKSVRTVTNALGYPFVIADRGVEKDADGVECTENEWGDLELLGDRPRPQGSKERDIQHASAILIITPDGRISRYLIGVDYDKTTVRRALIEAGEGKIGTRTEKLAMLCLAYDSVSGHYKPSMIALGLVAVPFGLVVLGIAFATVRSARREKKLKPVAEAVAPQLPG